MTAYNYKKAIRKYEKQGDFAFPMEDSMTLRRLVGLGLVAFFTWIQKNNQ
jgi:hypothetical protein